MGYPLIAMYDAMGLPISGHLYEEHIPPPTEISSIVKALHYAYSEIFISDSASSSGTITISEWLDHFLGEDLGATTQAGANMPDDFYAKPEDPLLSHLDFRTTRLRGQFTAVFRNSNLFYKASVPTTDKTITKGALSLSTKEESKAALDIGSLAAGGTFEKQSDKLTPKTDSHKPADGAPKSSKTAPLVKNSLLSNSSSVSKLAPYSDPQIQSVKGNSSSKLAPTVPKLDNNKPDPVSARPEQATGTTPTLLQTVLGTNTENNNKGAPISGKDGAISEENDATEQAGAKAIAHGVEVLCTIASTETNTPVPVTTQPATHPTDDDAMLPERPVMLKPSSESVSEGDMDLAQLSTQKRASESASHPDGSPPKKARVDLPADMKDLEEALSKAKTLQSNINHTIKCFMDNAGDEFTNPACNAERGRPSSMKDLIAKPVLNEVALVAAIDKSLKGWKAIFKGKTAPKGVTELMSELADLKKNLSDKGKHAVAFSVSNLRSDKEHVRERLNIGKKSHKSISTGFSSLKDYGISWDQLQMEVEKRKKQRLTEIEELEKALSLARSRLSTEELYEVKIGDLRGQYNQMLSETSAAISSFERLLAQGESCLMSINTVIRAAGRQGDSELPVSLQQQLKFVKSCVIEGNGGQEESDEDDE
ncbi:hypothetical protein ACQ4PT_060026 [Festuca glaucescens]